MIGSLQDLRFALRALRRAPGFALGVIAVLALGIGANTAMFTVLRATLWRPLAYRQPGQLVTLNAANAAGEPAGNLLPDLQAWQARSHDLAGLAYYTSDEVTLLTGKRQMEVAGVDGGANLFAVLGADPMMGRVFTAAEQQPGREHVVVLSYDVWRTEFGGDPKVLGRTVQVNDALCTVIGVMPRGFVFPAEGSAHAQIWTPAPLNPGAATRVMGEQTVFYDVVARRRAGVSVEALARELSGVQQSLAPLYSVADKSPRPADAVPTRVLAVDYRASLDAKQRKATLALTGAVALLWLIACADVASLSLARAAARRRERAVRAALGASRWRLVRQVFVEALLLSLSGGGVGLGLSAITLALFHHRLQQAFGAGLRLQPDLAVVGGLLLLSLLSAVAFSTAPVLFSAVHSLEEALRTDGAQAGTGRGQYRLQRLLVVGELALTLCLLVGCGLLLRTVFALRQVPLGFRTDHVYAITPNLDYFKYKKLDPNALVVQPLAERLRALPGVQSLAVTSVAPLANRFDVNFQLFMGNDAKDTKATHTLQAKLRAAGPELQQVLGFRMAKGRFFNASDTATSQPVAVVNRAFERLYSGTGGQDIGHFSLGGKERQFHIVGVLDDFHQTGIAEAPAPEIELNAAQRRPNDVFYQPTLQAHAEILLRSARDPKSLLPELRHALEATNPDLAGADIQTMDQIVEDAMGSQLLAAHLLELLGGLALLVALTGLYSLLAYLVTLRTREMGVRLALGAQRGDIARLVLRGAGGLLLTGAVLGVGLSLAGARLLSRFLYGVQAYDLRTFSLATAALLLVGIAAAWLPARHASAIEPTEALRAE